MRSNFIAFALFALVACGPPLTPDQSELRNIKWSNRVPKSSPTKFVKTFDQFCLPAMSVSDRAARLRRANYVPLQQMAAEGPQVFLVDDRRPAIVVSKTICSVRVLSRTGQTEKLNDHIKNTFPNATPLDPKLFGTDVEQIWQLAAERALIATERSTTIDGYSGYAVTIYRPSRFIR